MKFSVGEKVKVVVVYNSNYNHYTDSDGIVLSISATSVLPYDVEFPDGKRCAFYEDELISLRNNNKAKEVAALLQDLTTNQLNFGI